MDIDINVKTSIELKNLIDSKIKKVANELEIDNTTNGKIKYLEYKTDDDIEKLIFDTIVKWCSFFNSRENKRKLNRIFKRIYNHDCKQLIKMYYERHIGYNLNCSAPSLTSIIVSSFAKYIYDIMNIFRLTTNINKMIYNYSNDKTITVVKSSDVLTTDMYYQIVEYTVLKILFDKLLDYIIFKKYKFMDLIYDNIRSQIMINASSLMAANKKYIHITNEIVKNSNLSEQEKFEKLKMLLIQLFGYNSPYTHNITNASDYYTAKIALTKNFENYSDKIYESYKFTRDSLLRDCSQLAFITYYNLSEYFVVKNENRRKLLNVFN